jgi:hypothetical protein
MNATFKTDAGVEFRIETRPMKIGTPGPCVNLEMISRDRESLLAPLKQSEARSIASCLMGAAAEL